LKWPRLLPVTLVPKITKDFGIMAGLIQVFSEDGEGRVSSEPLVSITAPASFGHVQAQIGSSGTIYNANKVILGDKADLLAGRYTFVSAGEDYEFWT
jgi:hypothetical protein